MEVGEQLYSVEEQLDIECRIVLPPPGSLYIDSNGSLLVHLLWRFAFPWEQVGSPIG